MKAGRAGVLGWRAIEAVLDRLPQAALLFDDRGLFVHANRASLRLSGELELALGVRTFSDLLVPAESEGEGRKPATSEPFVLREAPPLPFRFHRFPLRTENDGLDGCLVLAYPEDDTGEWARDSVLEAMARLAGGVAHDFNNHLTAILGHAQLAGARLGESRASRANLRGIESAAERARRLTQQLLAFSRRQVTRQRDLDVTHEIERVGGALRAILGPAVIYETRLDHGAGKTRIDERQFDRILIGLARCTSSRAESGGECRIASSRKATDKGSSEVEIRFSFSPIDFHDLSGQADDSLQSVRELVERNKGSLLVADGGEAVLIRLRSAAEEGEVPRPSEGADVKSIWVVEDDDHVREVVSAILEHDGFHVFTAASGLRALELLGDGKPLDVMVTDVRMPGMNGVELYERVLRERPEMRVIFMSGLVEDEMLRQVLEDPALEFLQKPFTTVELRRHIARVLGQEPMGGKTRLLIVDDEAVIRDLVPQLIEGEGYECTTAETANEALSVLSSRPIDVVLCDIVMPDRDGLELLRDVRERFSETRFVAMTGRVGRGSSLQVATQLGAERTLSKPFSRDELLFALGAVKAPRARAS